MFIKYLFILPALATPAMADTYDVARVSAGDVLNLRADVLGYASPLDAEVIGTIPHDATGIRPAGRAIRFGDTVWREVIFDGQRGWVSSRYLEARFGTPAMPQALSCGGTEPFWGLQIDGSQGRLSDTEMPAPLSVTLSDAQGAHGRTNIWAYYLQSADGHPLTAIVDYNQSCSDGMSDVIYDYEVYLLGYQPQGAPVYGCCTVDR